MERRAKPVTKEKIFRSVVNLTAFPIGIQLLSGDWYWIEGWLFGIWWLALGVGVILYLYENDPELLAERFMRPGTGNHKQWDRYYLYILMVLFISWIVVMPLDAKRFGWTPHFP